MLSLRLADHPPDESSSKARECACTRLAAPANGFAFGG
jgi:hypothetical protein